MPRMLTRYRARQPALMNADRLRLWRALRRGEFPHARKIGPGDLESRLGLFEFHTKFRFQRLTTDYFPVAGRDGLTFPIDHRNFPRRGRRTPGMARA